MYAADYDGKLPPTAGSFVGIVHSTRPYLRDSSPYYCPENASTGTMKLSYRTPALYAGLPIAAGWSDPYLRGQAADPARTVLLYESDTDRDARIAPSYRHNGGAVFLMFTGQAALLQNLRRARTRRDVMRFHRTCCASDNVPVQEVSDGDWRGSGTRAHNGGCRDHCRADWAPIPARPR